MKYELVYILTPKLSDPDAEKKSKEVNELVRNESKEIVLEDFWGKKELAYPINKLDHGYYVLVQFKAKRLAVAKIEKQLRLETDVIRFLVVKKDTLVPIGVASEEKKEVEKTEEEVVENKETEVEEEVKKEESVEVKETEEIGVKSEAPKATEAEKEEILKEEVSEVKEEKKALKEEKADASDLDKKLDDILNEDLD